MFWRNGLYYYGNYNERVDLVSDDFHGFSGFVYKGNSELYMDFSYMADRELQTAIEIWKSSR
jgi:hypothetical protein